MKAKKFLAAMMAAVLAVSPLTVSAANVTPTDAPGSGDEIKIEGDNVYVDTLVYKVTLPTSTGLNFKLDPQGVFGYFTNPDGVTNTSPKKEDLSSFAGKIVGDGAHNIKNQSSVPVAVTCDYKLETDADGLEIKTTGTVDDSKKEVKLDIVGGTTDNTGKFTAATGSDAYAAAIGEESSKVQLVLGEADYVFKEGPNDSYTYEAATTGTTETTAAVSISGQISKDADWSDLTGSSAKKLTLSCVYSFDGVKDAAPTGLTKTAEGFVTAGADKLEYLGGASSNTLTATYSKATNSALWINIGDFDLKTVTLINNPTKGEQRTLLNTTSHYTYKPAAAADQRFALKSAWTNGLTLGDWVFELSDGSTIKTLTVHVTA